MKNTDPLTILNRISTETSKVSELHTLKSSFKKLKGAFFKTQFLIWKTFTLTRVNSLKKYLSYTTTLIRQVQILAILLSHSDSSTNSILFKVFSLLMFDSYSFSSDSQELFSTFSLITGFFLSCCVICLFLQVLLKKCLIINPLVLFINFSSFAITSALMVPILSNSIYNIKTDLLLNESFFNSSILKKFLFTLHFFCISIHILLTNLFNYESDFSSFEPKARGCSLFTFKQEIFIIILCVLGQVLSDIYFFFYVLVAALYMTRFFAVYEPYYKYSENFIEAGVWITASTLAFLLILGKLVSLTDQVVICFIFLTPLEYLLLNFYMTKIRCRNVHKAIDDPITLEFHLRKILYLNREVDEDQLELVEKLFEKATKEFLGYAPIWIWECNFVMQVKENYSLAAIKLLKILYSKNPPKILEKPEKDFKYPYCIEYEFHLYSLLRTLKKLEKFKDMLFVKYMIDFIYFKKLDAEACHCLLSVADNYLLGKSVTVQEIEKKFLGLYEIIKKKNEFYENSIKIYGNDQNFVEINLGFNVELMWKNASSSSVTSTRTREYFIERLTGDNNICNVAIMILSGDPKKLLNILYANDKLLSMLKYPDEKSIVGVSFDSLFHEYFFTQKKNFLNILLMNNSCQTELNQIFLLDYYGYAIEFNIELKVTFFKGISYFILYFNHLTAFHNYILITTTGSILTCSDRLKNIFTGFHKSIEEVLPGFMKNLVNQSENEQFTYTGTTGLYMFQYRLLQNEGKFVYVVYTNEQEHSLSFNCESPLLKRRRSLTFSGKEMNDMSGIKRSFSINKRKSRLSAEIIKSTKERYIDQSQRLRKIMKFLKIFTIFSLSLLALIYLIMIIYYSKFVDDSQYLSVINNVCDIQLTVISTLINLRSIDLLKNGINCYSNYNVYYNNLQQYNIDMSNWLSYVRTNENQYSLKSLFQEPKIILYNFKENVVTEEEQNLYQAMFILNQKLTELLSNNFSDLNNIHYIYKNSYLNLQTELNETVHKSVLSITNKAINILTPVKILNILTLFPFSFVFIVSLVIFFQLLKVYKDMIKKINLIPNKNFVLMRTRVVERIKKLHDSEFSLDFELFEKAQEKILICKKFFMYLIVVNVVVVGFFIAVEYGINSGFEESIGTRMQFRFFSDARIFAGQSFLWGREAALRKINLGYLDIFRDYTEVFSEKRKSSEKTRNLKFVNNFGIETSIELNQKFDFSKYIEFAIGDPCKALTGFGECSQSILAHGTSPAVNLLAADLGYFVDLSNFDQYKFLEIEKNVIILLTYFGESLKLFDSSTDYQNYYKNLSIITLSSMIFLIIIYFYHFLFTEISQIQNKLLSRNTLLKFFDTDRSQADLN